MAPGEQPKPQVPEKKDENNTKLKENDKDVETGTLGKAAEIRTIADEKVEKNKPQVRALQEMRDKPLPVAGKKSEEPMKPEQVKEAQEKIGKKIVEMAEARLSGPAKELCQAATKQMNEGQHESLGRLFLGWMKAVLPAYNDHNKSLAGRTKGIDKDAQLRQQVSLEEKDMPMNAALSMEKSVHRFINKRNGIPDAKYTHEKVWEEMRINAQMKFERNVTSDQRAATDMWFDKMADHFQSNNQTYSKLGVQGRSPEREARAKGLHDQLEKSGYNKTLEQHLKEWEKKNLIEEAIRVTDHPNSRGRVVMKGEKGDIKDSKDMTTDVTKLEISAKEKGDGKALQELIKKTLPGVTTTLTGDKVIIEKATVAEARKMVLALYKSEKDKPKPMAS
jgi:hypothetical protein